MPAEPDGARPHALLGWSGGKDAAWALHALRGRGEVEVVGLMTTITAGHERASMQGVRVEVLRAQADAAGLPLLESRIPVECDNACYEAAFAATLAQARERWPGIAAIAFGDLLLADIRAWREALCARLGWRALFPLFGAGIILGAIWAEAAWGRFWGWDPKETVSFITWVVYAAYLHARATSGWRNTRAAWINIAGFVAMLFNLFIINMVVSGLHSYAGLN